MTTTTIALCALAGLLLAGVILGRREIRRGRQRAQAGRRQARIESAQLGQMNGARWPAGWEAIPRFEAGTE